MSSTPDAESLDHDIEISVKILSFRLNEDSI